MTMSGKTSQTQSQMLSPAFMQNAQLLRNFPEIGYLYRKETDGDIRILLYGHYPNRIFNKKLNKNRYLRRISRGSRNRSVPAVKPLKIC